MHHLYKKIFSCIVLMMFATFSFAQNYTIPSSGTTTVTGCAGTILDPGGTSTYPNSCNGYMIITSDQAGCMPRILGNYTTESSFDHLYIYDGTGTGTQLADCTGTGSVDVTSTTGSLYLYFHSDGSVVYDGFALTLTCTGGCNCGGPVVTSSVSAGRIDVSWAAGTDVTHYFIEYGPHGFTPGTGTRTRITATSYTITGLTDGVQYDVYVWFDCGDDNVITTEEPTMISATPSSNINMPTSGHTQTVMCNGHVYDSGGPSANYTNSEDGVLTICADNPWCVLTVTGSYNTESCCDKITIYDGADENSTVLVGPVGGSGSVNVTSSSGVITIKFHSDGSVLYSGFDFTVSCSGTCECGSHPISGVQMSMDNMGYILSWNEATGDPSIHHYVIEYGLAGFTPGTGTTVTTTGSPYQLQGLTPGATYDFYVWADCGDDGVITNEVPAIVSYCVPDAVACIDFSDWNNPAIHGTYGTFSNPYATNGIVDNGPGSATSRHTLHHISEPDPRTGGGLMTVPPCELYSVRLGNWSTGAEAESISYDYAVDTADADILLLKYAAVLEDPSHSASEQPRFDFELLDQNGNRIDATCGYASFIANANLGWHNNNDVLWKDWTYVGFDVSAYHGQTVRVRLTTYDCDQSGHYGYAYFTLNCKKRTITAETCGEMLTNTYTAPAGFNYSWYYQRNPGVIISTDQSVTVTPNGTDMILCCHVSFVGNPNCGFDLTTTLTSRYPLAQFVPERDSCTWNFAMNNTSTISADGVTPIGNGESCETAHWDFGDGTTSDEYSPTHEFPGPGNYTITMVAGISGDECQDTATFTVDLLGNYPVISGDTSICQGEWTTLHATGGNTYAWYENGEEIVEGENLQVQPEQSTTYTLTSIAADGCEVEISQHVTVNPTTEFTFTDSICQGEGYNEHGFHIPAQLSAGSFTYTIVANNQYHCDSTITLNLVVKPTPNSVVGRDFNHCFEDFGDAVLTVPESGCEYHWNTGATTQNLSVSNGGTYSVTVTKNGCTSNSEITINDVCPFNIYLPNCITPTDNDGINDIFKLPTTKDIAEFEISIFDRWGKVIFHSTEASFEWDGSINGKTISGYTYTYRIDLKTVGAEKRILKGTITVL